MRIERPKRVVVIGSGLGGLLAGAALSKEHDVDVYERLDIYGGRFTNLPYRGFQLTTGALHMIPYGAYGPLGNLLKQVGADVKIVRCVPEGCIMKRDHTQVSFYDFRQILSPGSLAKVPVLMAKMLVQKKGTVADMVGNDPDMLALADSCCGWALSTTAQDTPAAEATGIVRNTVGGGREIHNTPGVPMGGCKAVVDALASRIEANGGRIHLASKVDAVTVEDGRATGVVVSGEKKEADMVVSDIGHRLTSRLYDAKYANPK